MPPHRMMLISGLVLVALGSVAILGCWAAPSELRLWLIPLAGFALIAIGARSGRRAGAE